MTLKRTRLVGGGILIAVFAMLILARCMPTEVVAGPIMAGPPTVNQVHLANISETLSTFKWMFGIFGALVAYIFIDLKMRVVKVEEKADTIEREFLSVKAFELAMDGRDKD